MKHGRDRPRARHGPHVSPRGLVVRAAIVVAAFALCHVLGLRHHTGVISGTPSFIAGSRRLAAVAGVAYACLYLATVVLVPIALIAAGIMHALGRRLAARRLGEAAQVHGAPPEQAASPPDEPGPPPP